MRVLLLFAAMLLAATCGFAQQGDKKVDRIIGGLYYGPLSNKDFFSESDYIFEGELVSHKNFANSDTTRVWTSTVFKITHVFKGGGEIRKGTIELVRDCGVLYESTEFGPGTGMQIINYNMDFCLGTYSKMILFCKKSDLAYQHTDNDIAVKPIENVRYAALYFSDVPEHTFKVYGLNDLYFDTVEDFYRYAGKRKEITAPETERKKKASLKGGSATEYATPLLDAFMKRQQELVDMALKNSADQRSAKATAANNLTLSVQNQRVTGGSTMYFEFDVCASASNGTTYYSNAISRIDFNTAIFGRDLVAKGKITLTQGATFGAGTYQTSVYDVSPTRVNISLNEKNGISSWSRTRLTTTPAVLFHVKMEILQNAPNGNAGMSFQETSFTSSFSLYTPTATGDPQTSLFYDATTYTNPVAYPIRLNPVINGFSPANVKAGVGEVLRVTGSGFGTSPGKVNFKNADAGGSGYIDGIGDYIRSWSDTQIEVVVPSRVFDNNTNKDASAGTGAFQVITAAGKVATSATDLIVDYSVLNAITPNALNNGRLYLVRKGSLNGLVFTLHTNVANNTSAVKCIEKALCAWSGRLGIELKLERNASGGYVTVSSKGVSGKNVIWQNPARTYGMATPVAAGACGSGSQAYYYRNDKCDVEFGGKASTTGALWDYRTSGTVPAGSGSFYNAFLHELGHVLGLDHVIDPNALMYYSIDANNSQPIINLSTTGGMPIPAVTRIFNDSRSLGWSCTGISQIASVSPTITYYAINDGDAETRNILRNVRLNNECTACPTHYMASESPAFSGAGWESYDTDPKFKLSKKRGKKTVYFKVKNVAGQSFTRSDQIYFRPLLSVTAAEATDLQREEAAGDARESVEAAEFLEESTSNDSDLLTYPVPCTDQIHITIPAQVSGSYEISIVDLGGVTVLTDHISTEQKTLDLTALRSGTYVIRLESNERTFVKMFVKQ